MRKLKIHILLYAMLICNVAIAQTKIRGIVKSQVDSECIIGAVVDILKTDSTRVMSTQTNDKGHFQFNAPLHDKLILKVSAMGYHESNMLIAGNQKELNVGDIYLSDKSVELQEVTVTGAGIVEKVDKYLVIPSADQLKRSASAIDLLKNLALPGLDVNLAGRSASVNGEGIIYQINGVPKSLDDVHAINSDNILRVEYSDNPGIRYINRGAGGVINFILKVRHTGGGLLENLSASPTCFAIDNNTRFALNFKKSEFALSYNLHWRDYKNKMMNSYDEYIADDKSIIRESAGRGAPFQGQVHDIFASYTYQHDKNSIFNATFAMKIQPATNNYISDNTEIKNSETIKYIETSNSKTNTNSPSLDLFYKRNFKNDQILELNVVGTFMDTKYDRDKYRIFPENKEEYLYGVNNRKWSIIAEAAYSKSFKKVSLRFGAQHTFSNTFNEYKNPYSKTKLLYNDTYFYGEAVGKIKKVNYAIGTGLKILSTENYNDNRRFFNNLTTVKVKYSPIKGLSFDYLMMYKPNIPTLSQLDDVTLTIDDILKTEGNPNLKPSNWLRNRLFINYSYKKVWARFWAIYDYEFNPIVKNIYYKDNYFITQPININYGSKINFQFDLGVRGLWNHLDLRASIYWNKYTANNYAAYHHTLSNLTLYFDATAYWGDWSVYANYSPLKSKMLIGESISVTDSKYYIQVQYKWKDFAFSVGGSYFFAKHGEKSVFESVSKINPYRSEVYIKENANWVTLGIIYKINFGRAYKKLNKSLNNSDSGGSAIIVQ